MFRIKICGITTVEDARAVVGAGADAVGLNFFANSPRYVEPKRAAQIVAALPAGLVKVGLFVNATSREVCERFDGLGLDLIQLHGDEPPAYVADLGGRPVMRAFRLRATGIDPITEYLEDCARFGCPPCRVLIDSHTKGMYGGTGVVADWETLSRMPRKPTFPPIVLAGGLTPENVAEAIHTVRPAAVDTASGVESSPGRKDPRLVEAFVRAAQAAFDQV